MRKAWNRTNLKSQELNDQTTFKESKYQDSLPCSFQDFSTSLSLFSKTLMVAWQHLSNRKGERQRDIKRHLSKKEQHPIKSDKHILYNKVY